MEDTSIEKLHIVPANENDQDAYESIPPELQSAI